MSAQLPRTSIGVGLRRAHFEGFRKHRPDVGFLELVSENYMDFGGRPREVVRELREHYRFMLHGVSLSIGGPDPLSHEHLKALRLLAEDLRVPFVSDHICWGKGHGTYYHDLIPLPLSKETIAHLKPRIAEAQDILGMPLVLENPSFYFIPPGSTMSEGEFLEELLAETDINLLLDINNVYVNAENNGFDAWDTIRRVPSERIAYTHMAGHEEARGFLIDTHGRPIKDDVLDLYARSLEHHGPLPTLLEWDTDLPSLDRLLQERQKLCKVMERLTAEKRSSFIRRHPRREGEVSR